MSNIKNGASGSYKQKKHKAVDPYILFGGINLDSLSSDSDDGKKKKKKKKEVEFL